MANQVVKIVLQAVDQATAVIKKTEGEVVSFGDKAKTAFGELKTALSSRILQGASLVGLGLALKKGWEEADALEASMRKLGGTAKITGTPLELLTKVATDAKAAFGLSTAQSNEFASAIARLTGRADRINETGDALAALLDVAAARGLSAADALQAINITLRGQDEGTDKLFDKNPSQIYKEWAERANLTASKITDTQKAEAILDEVLRAGEVTRNSYADYLKTAAGQQEQLKNRLQDTTAEFGRATGGVRDVLIPAVTIAADLFSGFIKIFQSFGTHVQGAVANVVDGVVGLAEVLGKVVTGDFKGAFDRGKAIVQNWRDNNAAVAFGVEEIWKKNATTTTGLVIEGLNKQNTGRKDAGEDAKKLEQEKAKELQRLNEELAVKLLMIDHGLTEAQAKEMVRRAYLLTGEQANMVQDLASGYKILDQYNTLLAAGFDKDVTPAVKRTEMALGDLADTTKTEFPAAKEVIGDVADATGDLDDKAKGLDPKFRDAAKAIQTAGEKFGFLDDQAGQALTDVVGVADAVARMAGGDPTAIVGAVANLGSLFGGLFGDNPVAAARKRTLEENSQRLRELTRVTGDLVNAQSSGATFGKVAGLDIGQLFSSGLSGSEIRSGTIGAGKLRDFLGAAGLTLADFQQAADDLGITIVDSAGNFILSAIQQVITGARTADLGAGNTFAGRLRTIDTGLQIGALAPGAEFGALLNAAGPNAITNLLSGIDVTTSEGRGQATAGLQDLFGKLSRGELSFADLGGLSRQEFEDLIARLIGILASDTAIDPFSIPTGNPDNPPVAFDVATGFESLQAPLDELPDYLAEANSHLSVIADAVTGGVGATESGGLGGATSTVVGGTQVIMYNTITVSGEAGATGTAVVEEINDALYNAFQRDRDNRGLADRD